MLNQACSILYLLQLTGHMEDMLIAAYNKFDAWKAKKMIKRWNL